MWVTTVTGTFLSLQTQLQATPWWDNYFASSSFAALVGDGLGLYSTPSIWTSTGPLFASGASFSTVGYSYWYPEVIWSSLSGIGSRTVGENVSLTWAVASTPAAVPEPLTILGSITAAGFGVAFKRKKNSIEKE